MRLIGGNISDQAIKRISTGSAFHIGSGATAEPDHVAFGTPTSSAEFSDIVTPYGSQLQHYYNGCWDFVQWGENSVGIFYIDNSDSNKLKYVHLQFNSGTGALSSQGSEVDLGSDVTGGNAAYLGLEVDKVSSTRCLVWYLNGNSTRNVNLVTYDKDSDSVTKHGAVQTDNTSVNSTKAFNGFSHCVIDADHAFAGTTTTSNTREGTIFKFTTTQSIGTTVDSSVANAGSDFAIGLAEYDSGSSKIFDSDGRKFYGEWTHSGTTITYGQTLSTTTHGGQNYYGHETYLGYRHDIEAGRRISIASDCVMDVTRSHVAPWAACRGRVNKDIGLMHSNRWDQNTASFNTNYWNRRAVRVDYDESTYWERFVAVHRGPSNGVALLPFKVNWNTLDACPVGNNSEDLEISDTDLDGTIPSLCFITGTGKKAIFIIFPQAANQPGRYLSVPITI